MKRILVPTDFSPTAEKAFRFATDIASRSGGAVTLLHVHTPAVKPFTGTAYSGDAGSDDAGATMMKQLQHLKHQVAVNNGGPAVSIVLGEGSVVDRILDFAVKEHHDMIVMGTQGTSGLKKNIMGSVAAHVIEKSLLPVLLIPEKYDWNEPSQFLFATNYQESDKYALQFLVPLVKLYNGKLTVVHLYDLYLMEEEKERKNFDEYAGMLRRKLKDEGMEFRFLKVSSVNEAMENLHTIVPYDILAMVSRRKTALEKIFVSSFTQNMAYLNTLPLLVIQETGP